MSRRGRRRRRRRRRGDGVIFTGEEHARAGVPSAANYLIRAGENLASATFSAPSKELAARRLHSKRDDGPIIIAARTKPERL